MDQLIQYKDLMGLGLLGIIGLIIAWLALRKKPAVPPTLPPPAAPATRPRIFAPFTASGTAAFSWGEDTVLDFRPRDVGCQTGVERYGIWDVPCTDKPALTPLLDGWGLNVKIRLDSYPAGVYDSVYANEGGRQPMGDKFVADLLLRWFPGHQDAKPPYPFAPKGCEIPAPIPAVVPPGEATDGDMLVVVSNGTVTQVRTFPIKVFMPPC